MTSLGAPGKAAGGQVEPWRTKALRRAEKHAQALATPSTAIPYCGDPTLSHAKPDQPRLAGNVLRTTMDPIERFVCLYAAELLKRRGKLPADASGFDAVLIRPRVVAFIRADGTQAEVARVKVPREI